MTKLKIARKTIRLLGALAFIALQSACSTSPVVFSAKERRDAVQHAVPAQELVAFVDRHGNLYPGPEVEVNLDAMTAVSEHSAEFASLEALYKRGADPEGWAKMRAQAGVPDTGTFDEQWNLVQTKLRASLVQQIQQRTQGTRPLVILIHGFNNDYATAYAWYHLVSEDVRKLQRDAVVLRLHWDGMVQSGVPVFIWREAQWNAPIVGLGLRDLLRSLPPSQPVRILTHSTGALVAANALGDATKPLDCERPGYAEYCKRISDSNTLPNQDLYRVALVIPAASLETFQNYPNASRTWPERMILGLNKDDFATDKLIFSCLRDGATCMNTWPADACREVKRAFEQAPSKTQVSLFEFSNSPGDSEGSKWIFWEEHSMEAQRNRSRWWPLLHQLLDANPAVSDDSVRFCR